LLKNPELQRRLLVGWVLLLALALAVVSILWIRSAGWFQEGQNIYRIRFERVPGLSIADPVEIRGWRVGQVVGFQPVKDGIEVRISLSDTLQVFADAHAKLVQSELFGSKRIELDCGKSSHLLSPSQSISGTSAPDLAVAIEKVGELVSAIPPEDIKDLVSQLKSFTQQLNRLLSDQRTDQLGQSLGHLNQLLSRLESIAGDVQERQLIREVSFSLSKLQHTLALADSSLAVVQKTVREGRALIPQVDTLLQTAQKATAEADTSLQLVKHNLRKLENNNSLAGRVLSDTTFSIQLDSTLNNLNKTMDFIQEKAINVRIKFFKQRARDADQ